MACDLWPAIWMLPTDERDGAWASSGEIDIMEFKGQEPDNLWGTLHYGEPWPKNKHTGAQYRRPSGKFTEGFHAYGLELEEAVIRWLLNGEVWQTQTKWDSGRAGFQRRFIWF